MKTRHRFCGKFTHNEEIYEYIYQPQSTKSMKIKFLSNHEILLLRWEIPDSIKHLFSNEDHVSIHFDVSHGFPFARQWNALI